MKFAESEFELNEIVEGEPLRSHLEAVYRATGIMPEQLADEPQVPYLTVHIWQWFCELSQERSIGFNGPERLRYSDMTDWAQAFDVKIEHWELRALRMIDNAFLKGMVKK